ncbi:methylated-DNA-[protein]-cysteine S-methyltransferase [Oceanobacillus limi]|uniref:methylated-DNA--[protein]-cysteine S-methyltransferase n=1 Tax=Oceanobacillus limi TaxID=930131 RepID=A0A1I0CBD3_9BACI|nr:methylated-DNA--[protein]-cysteine S-methyltransferase [Oceanobacillus limi]SET16827.1 methylated-DNA-[protein]-cysteine S-methyltransferase [Oceanobacillus limi]
MFLYDECLTNIGYLRFVFKEDGRLVRISLTEDFWHAFTAKYKVKMSHEIGRPIRQQFHEYLHGDRRQFNLLFELEGTLFQKETWLALRNIPYGEVRSYSEIATSIRKPNANRAVGYANAVNPLPILIPCHRVIGKNCNLAGYAGGSGMKKQLLGIECFEISGEQLLTRKMK